MAPRKTAALGDDAEKIARDEADLAERKRKLGIEPDENQLTIDVDEEGNVAPASTEIANPEDVKAPWLFEHIDFYGEQWEVRKPSQQALAAFALSSGKYIPQKLQNDLVGLFIKQHMSEECHEKVYVRLMDPDDPDFTPKTLGELMAAIATLE